jgi:hypothetical protein
MAEWLKAHAWKAILQNSFHQVLFSTLYSHFYPTKSIKRVPSTRKHNPLQSISVE